MPEFRSRTGIFRGMFPYELRNVAEGIRASIQEELRDLSTTVGAVDQWVTDQDLTMVPEQLGLLRPLYDCEDPERVLFTRTRPEDRSL